MKTISAVLLLAILLFGGCYSTNNFEGKKTEELNREYYARIEPVRVVLNEAVGPQLGYDNHNLKATGMTFTYDAIDKDHEVVFSNLKVSYSKDGSEPLPMEIAYAESLHDVSSRWNRINLLKAYLVPTEVIGPPEKEIEHLDQFTRPMESGRYLVTVSFDEDGVSRELVFDFVYKGRIKYAGMPIGNISGK
jgi:hypothetical protein